MLSFLPSFLPELTRGARVAAMAVAALAAVVVHQAHAEALLVDVPVPQQAAGVRGQGTWETTLQGRDLDGNTANGFEAYYDTALDITWLADANYANTSGYISDGYMNWDDAKTWALNLNVNGTTGWRIPTLVDMGTLGCDYANNGTDCGWNVDTSTSELAHMYYVTLGNKPIYDTFGNVQLGYGLMNSGPFQNVSLSNYWSGVEYAPDTAYAWFFGNYFGGQYYRSKSDGFAAWAVHPGDVGSPVPEPSVYALALAGLTVAALARRRRAA